ncbi:uncharacterized protein [Physcomitrium patens]|uniref:C2H2-type domain-containing protein n=1 Tax=Physcomitrium patens TaxID=3218 RepID=A9S9U8_PHYPA|nr:uncharacterized protein LOC112281470 isoform X1 [Physcomitrium patens]PNR62726.1 hypothetical protein PHYPA_001150 [Physcomitrium patens]|eukprot:XP_024373799.1 uncharacterized protein LOC112281470 isoform X1 [Physcomitrella patens]
MENNVLWSSQLTGLVCYGQQVCDEEGMSVLLQVRTIAEIGAWSLEVEDLLHWAAPRSVQLGSRTKDVVALNGSACGGIVHTCAVCSGDLKVLRNMQEHTNGH